MVDFHPCRNFKSRSRQAIQSLMDMYQLQRDFYQARAVRNIDFANKTIAETETHKKSYEDALGKCKEIMADLDSKISSAVNESLWPLKYQNKTLNWRLEFYAEREKRRSENRREKRMRKKQRKAEAKGRNRMDVDANEADEE